MAYVLNYEKPILLVVGFVEGNRKPYNQVQDCTFSSYIMLILFLFTLALYFGKCTQWIGYLYMYILDFFLYYEAWCLYLFINIQEFALGNL